MNAQHKQQAIEQRQRMIAELQHTIETLAMLPDDLPGELWKGTEQIYIELPASDKALHEFRRVLGPDWECVDTHFHAQLGRQFRTYMNDKRSIRVVMCPNVDGATCSLRVASTKQVPIYEMVCQG